MQSQTRFKIAKIDFLVVNNKYIYMHYHVEIVYMFKKSLFFFLNKGLSIKIWLFFVYKTIFSNIAKYKDDTHIYIELLK